MNFQTTISGKEFCRRNCGNYGKERFFEEYYRILHTAYLRSDNSSCLEVIRNDFENSFGSDLDTVSVSYIFATAKYLVYDVVVASLLSDGKIDNRYYFNKLIIELGFDVWLIYSFENRGRLHMNDFYKWQPLAKNDKTERAISDFWHFKLPKAHKFSHLYDGIKQYKKEILETYRKLLQGKNDAALDEDSVKNILAYIDSVCPAVSEQKAETRIPVVIMSSEDNSSVENQGYSDYEESADDIADHTNDFLENITAQDGMLEAELSVMDSLDGPVTIEETPHAIDEIIEASQDVADVNVNALKAADIFFTVPDVSSETDISEENVAEEIKSEPVAEEIKSEPVAEEIKSEPIEEEIKIEEIVAETPAVEKYSFPHLDGETVQKPDSEVKSVSIKKPVFETISKAQVIADSIISDSNKATPETPKIKVVTPSDYIPYKNNQKEFAANRNREALRSISKSENTDASGKGFKKNCHEITKNKVVTAAVCVGIASVLLVPLAITCFGKGKKK